MSRLSSGFPPRTLTQVQVKIDRHVLTQGVLIDSGADESLMDWGLAKKWNCGVIPLTQPLKASALDGRLLFTVTHCTMPIEVTVNATHTEHMTFHLFDSAQHPLILGYPWLVKHNPHIDWRSGRVKGWGEDCKHFCLRDNKTGDNTPHARRIETQAVVQIACTEMTEAIQVQEQDFPDVEETSV